MDGLTADGLTADGFAAVAFAAVALGLGDSSEFEDTFFLRETLGGDTDAFAADGLAADGLAADGLAADAFAADDFAFGDSSELEGIFFLRLTRKVPEDSVLEFSFDAFSFDVRILISGLISCKVNKCSAISV